MERAQIRSQAAAWLALLQSEDRTPADEAGFRAWLAQGPAYQQAFDSVTSAWEAAGGLAAEYSLDELLQPRPSRRLAFAAGFAAAVAAVLVIAATWGISQSGRAYATAPGETRRLAFADGSAMVLDSDTAVRVKLRRSRRDVRLERGRAHFEVAKDPTRPFVVTAGERRVTALGTVFNVSRSASETSVVLLEGRVAVQSADLWGAQEPGRILLPGERLTFDDAGEVRHDRPNLAKLTAWEQGQALFDNDTVAAAAAELNRYSRRPLVVDDPKVARMRVSGVFRAGATQDFALSVQTLLPVKASVERDRIVLRGDASLR